MSTESKRRTALIVGAGIGGLAAALALRRAGWTISVFERAATARELGFALLLAPNAMLALDELGLADLVAAGGTIVRDGEIRRGRGDVLRRLDARVVSAALGAPTVCVLRPVLHGILLDAVGDDAVSLSSEAVAFSQDERGVRLTLAGGDIARGDLLIGADGVGSTVRRVLHPDEPPPRSSGLFALRGVAIDVADRLGNLSAVQYFACGIEAGLCRASERAVYWYLSIPAARVARVGRDVAMLAAEVSTSFDDTFRSVVAATRREELRLDELFERDPVEPWGAGAVTLLGDAAHPMLPHAGQGAAQALEDAVALGRALSVGVDPTIGLRAYEGRRVPRRRAVAAAASRNARIGSLESGVGCWLRDWAIRLVPEAVVVRSLIAVARPG